MSRKIKNQIKKLHKENKIIQAYWDAGNDSTMCNLKIKDMPVDDIADWDNLRNYMVDILIDVLQLPNASEDHHAGDGILDINENEEITLTYDNVYTSPYPSSEDLNNSNDEEKISEQFAYDDIYGFVPYLSRVSVTFSTYNEHTVYLNIRVLEGDEINFSMEAENHLKEAILKMISPFYESFKVFGEESYFGTKRKIPDNYNNYADGNKKALDYVEVEGELQKDSKMYCVITQYYQYVTYTKNKTIILIP